MTDQESISYSSEKTTPSKRRSVLDDAIADGLTKIRTMKGLKQNELAEVLGIKPQMISRYETKESIVPFGVAYEIAAKLGVPLETFFSTLNDPSKNYALSDNQQEMIGHYFDNTETSQEDIEKLKQAYFSIKNPQKRADFISVIENIVNTYKD